MRILRVGPLPDSALAAAAAFHADVLPRAVDHLASGEGLAIVFTAADHAHRGWRLAAVQGLAREHAPQRVNGLESSDEAAIAAALGWLAGAGGVTGQLLPLDGAGAGAVL